MKRRKFILSLLTALVLVTYSVSGCVGKVETYTDSGQAINVGVNQEFLIALGSNPTTGYIWQVSYDGNVLKLIENRYEPQKTGQNLVGAGGIDFFRFQAMNKGEAKITLNYKRPWEEKPIEQKTFTVNID